MEKKQAMEKEYGAQGQEVHPALAKYEYLLQKLAPKRELPWLIYLEIVPGQFLELFYPREKMITVEGLTDGDVVRAGYAHLSLEVEDIKAAVENLASKGILPTSEITFGPDFTYQCWFEDPDGNRIELMQYTDKSLQVVGTKIVEN